MIYYRRIPSSLSPATRGHWYADPATRLFHLERNSNTLVGGPSPNKSSSSLISKAVRNLIAHLTWTVKDRCEFIARSRRDVAIFSSSIIVCLVSHDRNYFVWEATGSVFNRYLVLCAELSIHASYVLRHQLERMITI